VESDNIRKKTQKQNKQDDFQIIRRIKMVTLDNVVERVRQFDGDISRKRDYERAKQGLEIIKAYQGAFKEALKAETGFDEMNLPEGTKETEIEKGDIVFTIKSNRTTIKPQYMQAVTGMENYIKGVNMLLSEGRAITGMIKHQGTYFTDAERLLETYAGMVAGLMVPGVRHVPKYEAPESAAPETLKLDANRIALTQASFEKYVAADQLKSDLEEFVEEYESKLSGGKKGVSRVNTRSGYKKKKSTSEGTDWAYVVKKLLRVKPEDAPGELDIVADPSISLAEKRRQLPHLDMAYHQVNGDRKVYVSMTSIYDRIQTLKDSETIISKRTKIEPVEIV
jgi:hypothetical protein